MYNCGPTVYERAHVGNLASFLFADFLRRYLEYLGFKVKQVKNITDVGHLTAEDSESGEDKLQQSANKKKKDPSEIAAYYTKLFIKNEQELNIEEPFARPRATQYIKEMQAIIANLLAKGFAYERNGEVFFDLSKFKNYGKLSGNTLEKLQEGARVEINPSKKSPFDFTLWRKASANHLMKWESPWGIGYPGWHIECSAMINSLLGPQIDIHTGGEDNIFPHHESEIAQSEAATGKTPFVKYWLHRRHIFVDGQKMSKSKNNFYTLDDIKKMGFRPLDFRLAVFKSHYRENMNFSPAVLKEAQGDLDRVSEIYQLYNLPPLKDSTSINAHDQEKLFNFIATQNKLFIDAMNDDLNTYRAYECWINIFIKINEYINKNINLSSKARDLNVATEPLTKIIIGQTFLKLLAKDRATLSQAEDLLKQRSEYKQAGNWQQADAIRNTINEFGYKIIDRPAGPLLLKTL